MAKPGVVTCPGCGARVRPAAPGEGTARRRCPKCGERLGAGGAPDDARPRRKKSRRPDPRLRLLLFGGAGLAVFLVCGGGFSFWLYQRLRSDRPSVPVPTSYETFEASDGSFRCDCPAGWKLSVEGIKDHRDLTCTRGGASIRISQGLVGSILGDIAAAGPEDNDPDRAPVARVHEFKRKLVTEQLADYQEERAETVRSGFGPARRSAFTASGFLGRKVRGYRATALGHMTGYDVLCQCPAADWEGLRPVFAHVIESLGSGPGG